MSRQTWIVAGVVGIAAFAAGASAEEGARWIGAFASHRSMERYDMSVGVTAGQLPRRPDRFEENREVMNVPGHYGTLFAVTGVSDDVVLWYRDADGALRNAVVRDVANRPLKIQSAVTARYEADARDERR